MSSFSYKTSPSLAKLDQHTVYLAFSNGIESSPRILRFSWDGQEIRDYSLDLRRIPFCVDQQGFYFTFRSFSAAKKSGFRFSYSYSFFSYGK